MSRFKQDFWNKLTRFQKLQVLGTTASIVTLIDLVIIYVRY